MGSQRVGHDRVTKSFTFRSSQERCGWSSGPDTEASVGQVATAALADPPLECLLRLGPAPLATWLASTNTAARRGSCASSGAKPSPRAFLHIVEPWAAVVKVQLPGESTWRGYIEREKAWGYTGRGRGTDGQRGEAGSPRGALSIVPAAQPWDRGCWPRASVLNDLKLLMRKFPLDECLFCRRLIYSSGLSWLLFWWIGAATIKRWVLFVIGGAGPLLLRERFSGCGAQASHCSGFSRCGGQVLGCMGLQKLQLPGPGAQAQELWYAGLVVRRHVGSSWIRDRTRVSRLGRWILHHQATREALTPFLK